MVGWGKGVSLRIRLKTQSQMLKKCLIKNICTGRFSGRFRRIPIGWELSYIVLTNGSEYQVLPLYSRS